MGRNAIHRASEVLARLAAHRDRRRRRRRARVPGVVPGRRHRGRDPRQAQRRARPLHHHREPPVRAEVLARGGGGAGAGDARGRRRRRDPPGAGRGAAEPRQPAGRRLRARPLAPRAAQARVDRRRPLRVPWDPRAQLRARRPDDRAHPGRARDAGVDRSGVRRARRGSSAWRTPEPGVHRVVRSRRWLADEG